MYDLERGIHTVLAIVRDVSAREKAEQALREFEAVVQSASDIIIRTNMQGVIRLWNPAAEKLVGYTRAEAIGRPLRDFIPPDRVSIYRSIMGRALQHGEVHEHRGVIERADGARLNLSITLAGITNDHGVEGAVFVARDLTPQIHLAAGVYHYTHHDQLTGLPNRLLLHQILETCILLAQNTEQQVAVVLLDLAGLSEVNNVLGYEAGDQLLEVVAERLAASIGLTARVGRIGSFEFALILPDTDLTGATRVVRDVEHALASPIVIDGQRVQIEGTTGIAVYPADGSSAGPLLQRAAVAARSAKHTGIRSAHYASVQYRSTSHDLTLRADLRQALTGNQLALFYQPIVSLDINRVRGVEALLRWRHPERGLLGPDEFLPRINDVGLFEDITLWVLRTAAQQLAAWTDAGLDLRASVNLAPQNFYDIGLTAIIHDLLLSHGLPGTSLVIEVTESVLMSHRVQAQEILQQLRDWGVEVVIDDFGTGYSSLAYLHQLPIQRIKVDRSFFSGKVEDGMVIVQAIIDLAHALGLRVTAEGIETQYLLDAVRRMGCDAAQGYYISRPLPAEQVPSWMAAQPVLGPER